VPPSDAAGTLCTDLFRDDTADGGKLVREAVSFVVVPQVEPARQPITACQGRLDGPREAGIDSRPMKGLSASWTSPRSGVARAAMLVGLVLVPGCAISWSDGSGGQHQIGSAWAIETELPRGVQRSSFALGLDLRFGGWEPGLTLGFRSQRTIVPETSLCAHGAALAEGVAQQMRTPVPPGGASHVCMLWCTDPAASAATCLTSWSIGFDVCFDGPAPGCTFGVRGVDALVGRALDQDSVLCVVHDANDPDQLSAVLWRLAKEDP
jgi:hypothetical protein